jgi:hypothetical protein
MIYFSNSLKHCRRYFSSSSQAAGSLKDTIKSYLVVPFRAKTEIRRESVESVSSENTSSQPVNYYQLAKEL